MPPWTPPKQWMRITTIDAHTAGEPFRVVTGGFPEIPGATLLEQRRHVRQYYDHLRTALMWEPRGHADMYGCLLTRPAHPQADLGVLFMHNEGYSTMCGHGIIGLVTVVLETGLWPSTGTETTLHIETPAGLVKAIATVNGRRVTRVRFQNVPAYVLELNQMLPVPGMGHVRHDIAFGGAFYAFVQAEAVGLVCTPDNFRALVDQGMAIKEAVMAQRSIRHPFEPDLGFLYGTIFIGPALDPQNHSRNVCIFADGEVDRSPTGTGLSARLAIHHARHEIATGQAVTVESIIGSCFGGRVIETTRFGPYEAIVPEIEGTAHITGRHEFVIDPEDPLRDGFILR